VRLQTVHASPALIEANCWLRVIAACPLARR
jgi:hypothetical protein